MIDDKDIELIEDYLRDRLSDAEKTAFEDRLGSDDELREAWRQHQWVLDGFDGMRLQKVEERVAKLASASEAGSVMSWKRIRPFVLLALIALVFYFVVEKYNAGADQPKPRALASEYYDPPAGLTTRSESTALSESLRNAMTAYEDRQWDAAAQHFRSVTEPAELPVARYYLAHSLYRSDQLEEAVQAFMLSRDDSQYAQQAEWYLALSYLKNDDVSAARDRLSLIVADDAHFYQSKAIKLLEEIAGRRR